MQQVNFWQRFDWVLFTTTLLLVTFGILVIASATQDAVDPTLINRVPLQIRYAVLGFGLLFVFAAIDYRLFSGLYPYLYTLMIVLLLAVVFFGVEGDAGARRWINVGILIQPSEIGKILLILTLSTFFTRHYHKMGNLLTVFRSLLHVAVPAALIVIQPDLSTTIVYLVIWAVITWSAGLRLHHIGLVLVAGVIALPFVIPQLPDYQIGRITDFLFPQDDLEAQFGSQYNIQQARIAIGSGGVFGKGYTAGSQNSGRFLRVRHTDFIFSVIAHEFGFVGSTVTMALIGLLLFRILRGARYASDPLGSMICYGVGGMIFFQTVVSIGMNLNLMPVTGLTLPLVSSGGTSLLFTLVGIGLVQSVIVRRRMKEF